MRRIVWMASCLLILLPSACVATVVRGQDVQGEVVVVSPRVGEVIDRQERDRYGLFKCFAGFQSAVFRWLPDGRYAIDITYVDEGRQRTQVWTISEREFVQNYRKVIEEYGAKSARPEGEEPGPEVQLTWKNGDRQVVRLLSLRGDSLFFSRGNESSVEAGSAAVDSLARVSLIRHASMKTVLVASAAAGLAGGLIGLASGDDPPGWFSMNAEEKATLLGGTLSGAILLTGGLRQAVRATDVDIPLSDLAAAKRYEVLVQVLEGTYHPPLPLNLFAAPVLVRYPKGAISRGFLAGFCSRLKPSVGFELMYEKSFWSSWEETEHTAYETEEVTQREKHRLSCVAGRLLFVLRNGGRAQPYITTGLAFGRWHQQTHSHSVYRDPYTGERQAGDLTWSEEDVLFGCPLGVGVLVQLTGPVGLDLRLERFLAYATPWQVSMGLAVRAKSSL